MFFASDPDWSRRCERLVTQMLADFGGRGLNDQNFSFVVIRESAGRQEPCGYAYRGDWRCYPCSLVKVFHLVHVLHLIEAGQIQPHDELSRAMRDMILWSSNTATNYVIDLVTGTTGDTLLDPAAFEAWRDRRESLNGFFQALDWPEYAGCNISQKLMDDVRYGREAQYAGKNGYYLNVLTPLAASRLFFEIFAGEVPLTTQKRKTAQDILLRDRSSDEAKLPHFQVSEYLGGGIPQNATLWSKAGRNGWTGTEQASYYKHDLIRVALPDRPALIVCVMTRGKQICEDDPQLFPDMGKKIADALLG